MLAEYIRRTRAGESPRVFQEEKTGDSLRKKEGLMLRLRLASGVPSFSFEEISATLPTAEASRVWESFDAGLLEVVGEGRDRRVRLTRRGVLLSNEVFALFL
jgi:coproporphyrinogen III oxidase-like Fe-S oxidoreductase